MRQDSGPIYNIKGYPVIAPDPKELDRLGGIFTGVYQMSSGQRTEQAGRYFAAELGTRPEFKGGRLGERLNASSLEALSLVDGRPILQLLADNNIGR